LFAKIKAVSKRTIYLYLPDEAKDKEKQRIARGSLQNCSDTTDKKNKSHSHQTASGENYSPGKVILDTKLADIIHDSVRSDKSNGYPYRFLLRHDGRNVSSVEDYESEDASPSSIAKRNESDSKSKDVLLYPGHSEVKNENNELNSSNTESPDCKVHMQIIHDLEDTIRELEQIEVEISIPFHDLRMHMIRLRNLSGEREPVLIYLTIDLTCNKVSYTLGKNRAELEH